MLSTEFLRRQAENCLRIARSCFDLSSAERLRLMANDLNAKAEEIERERRFRPRFFEPTIPEEQVRGPASVGEQRDVPPTIADHLIEVGRYSA